MITTTVLLFLGGTFDVPTGKLHLEPAALGFETDSTAFTAYAPDGTALSAERIAEHTVLDDSGLEGRRHFLLGGDADYLAVPLQRIAQGMRDRRVDVRVWMLPRGTRALAWLYWPSGADLAAIVRLHPTGRGTDDGWREYASGPIDFSLASRLDPVLYLRDSQPTPSPGNIFSFSGVTRNDALRVAIDAIEVVDLGPKAVPDLACDTPTEVACGPKGACLFGRCADRAAVFGPVPPEPLRRAYVERYQHLFRTFEGVRAAKIPEAVAVLEAVKGSDDPRAFWAAFSSIGLLLDGHASVPLAAYHSIADSGACLALGSADLLPGGGERPMVFRQPAAGSAAGALRRGDVVARIDGVPVSDWMASHVTELPYSGDPGAAPVVRALRLLPLAVRRASVIELERCEVPTGCSAAEVQTVRLDLARELGARVWSQTLRAIDLTPTPCDNRFSQQFAGRGAEAYPFAATIDLDPDTRLLHFNGFPQSVEPGHDTWAAALADSVSVSRRGFIIDHRDGEGGWPEEAFEVLFDSLHAGPIAANGHFLPNIEGAPLETSLAQMRSCSQWRFRAGYSDLYQCGGLLRIGYDRATGSRSNANAKVALLTALDVSGSDVFPYLLKQRSGPTRIFGPGPTMGGFGAVHLNPSYGMAISGGSLQVQDGLFLTGPNDTNRKFESGAGVPPDVRVIQLQSDAIVGVDTVLQAANAWVHQ